ncbi:MAG: DUF424 family protein [Methanomassiliicoccaceae archaeon]|jgi:hypothetical protein|nr:DUF424 family protein [Methanomassiliicoccaceae archaeon]
MISVRIHIRDGERILAACDHELLGQTFTGDGTRLKVSEIFYGGDTISEEAFAERMKNVTIMNLVGDRTTDIAKKAGYVSEDSIIVIGGVKHAQAVIM